jgi:hypothetical protein
MLAIVSLNTNMCAKCLQMMNLEGVRLNLVDLTNAKKVTSLILSV